MSSIMKTVQGSFHQGNEKFGHTAVNQCTCCSLFSVVFTLIKSPGYWDRKDLDFILENGDTIYKGLNTSEYLMFSELPREIPLFKSAVRVDFMENKFGFLNASSVPGSSLLDKQVSSESNGLLLLIKGLCISVVWTKKHFYLFDSHSKNEKGECCPEGFSIILKFDGKTALESHIIKNYLTKEDGNKQFEIQYIKVTKTNDHYDFTKPYSASKDRKRKSTDIEKEKCRNRKATDIEKEKCRKRNATDIQKEKCRKRKATDIAS